ncbi:Clp protease N-terminal domain-containing protein, partial [Bathymodiolus platifrons methanotrophic gill symbiont]
MNPEKLTSKFKSALNDAQSLALAKDHQFIEAVHLLLAMLEQQGGSIKPLLNQAGTNTQALAQLLDQELGTMPSVSGVGGDVQVSSDLNKLLNLTEQLAVKRNDSFVSSEIFLLAACASKGQLAKILKQANVSQQLQARHATSQHSGTPVTNIHSPTQRMG